MDTIRHNDDLTLRRYLRDLHANPLLAEEEERILAQRLMEAREALALIVQRLPPSCKETIFGEDFQGEEITPESSFIVIDTFYHHLVRYAKEHPEPAVIRMAAEARLHKNRLDNARGAFIASHLRFVVHIAKAYARTGIPLSDLIQDGNLGLMRAVEKYDYRRGLKFTTYAAWWVHREIRLGVGTKKRTIRIPDYQMRKNYRIAQAAQRLTRTLVRKPTPEEIAAEADMSLESVMKFLSFRPDTVSLEGLAHTLNGDAFLDTLADPDASLPSQEIIKQESLDHLRQSLRFLRPREKEVIRLRFGFDKDRSYTLKEIGRLMNLSHERIRQIETEALRILHSLLGTPFRGRKPSVS